MGTEIIGESKSIEYSTPPVLVEPLIKEFNLTKDVCASPENYKLPDYNGYQMYDEILFHSH